MKTILVEIKINDDSFEEPIVEVGNITDSGDYCYTDLSVRQITLPTEDEQWEPFQDALYATGRFTLYECDQLTDGILQYIKDCGIELIKIKEQ
jgi:hypothetical protein